MTTFVIFTCVAFIALTFAIAWLFYNQKNLPREEKKQNSDRLVQITRLDWKVKALLWLAIILILFSFAAPFIFTRMSVTSDFNLLQTGQIGDTVGGLMNPFIALSGIVITGLAFYPG